MRVLLGMIIPASCVPSFFFFQSTVQLDMRTCFVVLVPGHFINGTDFASVFSRSQRAIFLSNLLSDSSLSKLINAVVSQSVMLSLY